MGLAGAAGGRKGIVKAIYQNNRNAIVCVEKRLYTII